MLFVVCCLLFVVVHNALIAVGCLSFAVRCSLCVVCRVVFVACCCFGVC